MDQDQAGAPPAPARDNVKPRPGRSLRSSLFGGACALALAVCALLVLFARHELDAMLQDEAAREVSGMMRIIISALRHEYDMVAGGLQGSESLARDNLRQLSSAAKDLIRRAGNSGKDQTVARREALDALGALDGRSRFVILDTRTGVIFEPGPPETRDRSHIHNAVRRMAGRGVDGFDTVRYRNRDGLDVEHVIYGRVYAPWNWYVAVECGLSGLGDEAEAHLRGIAADLSDALAATVKGKKAAFFIFDSQGRLIISPDPCCGPVTFKSGNLDATLLKDLRTAGDTGTSLVHTQASGSEEDLLACVRRFAPLDWYVCGVFAQKDLDLEAGSKINRFIIILLLVLLPVLPLAWILLGRATAPMRAISGYAATLGQDEAIPPEHQKQMRALAQKDGELGRLAASLLDLDDNLKDRAATVCQAAQEQEDKAKERASQLEEANARLRREIDERMKVQIGLAESELRYRGMVEDQAELLARFTPDGAVTFVNPAYCRFFGKTPEEMIGRSIYVNLPKDDRQKLQDHLAALGPDRPVGTIEHRAILPDGSTRWVHWADRAIVDHHGVVVEFQSVGFDITDKVKAMDGLSRAESTMRALLDSAGDMILLMDLEGGVIDINKEGARRLNTTQEAIRGHSIFEFMPPTVHAQRLSDGLRALQTGEVYTTIDRRDDLTYEATYAPIRDKSGQIVQMALFATDISDRVKVESELDQRRQALAAEVQERTAALENNLAELRRQAQEREAVEQRLLQYQNRLRALTMRTSHGEDQERRRLAGEIHDRIGQTLALARMDVESLRSSPNPVPLLDDLQILLDGAMAAARTLVFEISPPMLHEIGLAEAVDWLAETLLTSRNLHVNLNLTQAPTIPDPEHRDVLFHCIRELLLNIALHAYASQVDITITTGNSSLIVQIHDNGKGFDPDIIQNGKTFGLFDVQERVGYLGGILEIASTPGQGTTATITTPL